MGSHFSGALYGGKAIRVTSYGQWGGLVTLPLLDLTPPGCNPQQGKRRCCLSMIDKEVCQTTRMVRTRDERILIGFPARK